MLWPPVSLIDSHVVREDVETDGQGVFVATCIIWTVGWFAAFYFIRWIQFLWMRRLKKSTKLHENDRNWTARNVLGIVHAVLISGICVPCFVMFLDAPSDVRFDASPHIADCRVDRGDTGAMPWDFAGQAIAIAGIAFTTFTIADVFISTLYGLSSRDYRIHHTAFITVGLMVRSNCMLPYNAAILLSMECSTPFLNFWTLVMNRGADYSWSTCVSGAAFVVLFLAIRIVLNTYGAVYLIVNHDIAMPPWVPESIFWFLLVAITVGAGVQYCWLHSVALKFWEQARRMSRDDPRALKIEYRNEQSPRQVVAPTAAARMSDEDVNQIDQHEEQHAGQIEAM
jgi:hypothetical protein